MALLTWSNGVGRVGDAHVLVDVYDKPVMPFAFDALYYEPDTGMRLKISTQGQQSLTPDECAACESTAAALLAAADYPVQIWDADGIYRGTQLKSEAEHQGLFWCLDAPEHPAAKRVDDGWARVVAVIMDDGSLREMPESVCQLCLLAFTEAEWAAFPGKPATPYETWDFAAEAWVDKRRLEDVREEARILIRRVFEGVRAQWLDAIPDLERQTWQKQETEARAWLADNSVSTPFIDVALSGRATPKGTFCADVLANADTAWRRLARAHNLQWQWFDKVTACAAPQEVDAVAFALGEARFDPEGV